MVCCFTGHRTIKDCDKALLSERLDTAILWLADRGYTVFRTGGARGFDTLAALRVLHLRAQHPQIRLSLILPCRDQSKGWPPAEQRLWKSILEQADEVQFLHDSYTPQCMHERNRALVDGCNICVSYLTEPRGGTLYTCNYAARQGVRVWNIAPPKKAQ